MTQAYHPKFPQTPTGSLYPVNYIVSVIDDLDEAKAKLDELNYQKNIFQRFLSSFQDATDDTGTDVYRFEAKEGHHLLFVRACDASLRACSPEEIRQIRELLGRYHARTVKLFSPWWVEDLPPLKQSNAQEH